MSACRLFFVELYRTLILQVRYPMDFISGLILLTFLFYGLLVGAQHITGSDSFNENLNGIIVGYSVWMILYSGMNHIPSTVQGEAQRGTLEAVFLSYISISMIFMMRAISASFISVVFTLIILLFLLWITDREVAFPVSILLPALATVLAAIGMGFVAGGIALEYKQVGQVLVLAQYPLLFLMMTPFENLDPFLMQYTLYLPVVPSAITLRELMVAQMPFFETHYIASLINGVVYLGIGMAVFKNFINKVKVKGVLAGY